MLQDDWLKASVTANPGASALSDVIFHMISDALGEVDEDVVRVCAGVAVAVASVVIAGWAFRCFSGSRDRAVPISAVQITDDYDDRKGKERTRAPMADSGTIEKAINEGKFQDGYVDHDDEGKNENEEDHDSKVNQGTSPGPQDATDSLLPPPSSAKTTPVPAVTPERSSNRPVTRSMTAQAGKVRAIPGA